MSVADNFSAFLENLAIQNGETISLRYGELTAALNKKFRDTESKTVGSFGRGTGIDGLSDLDMLYRLAWTSRGPRLHVESPEVTAEAHGDSRSFLRCRA